jgi:hypothetical protein
MTARLLPGGDLGIHTRSCADHGPALLLAGSLAALLLAGCSLFEPTSPEAGSGGTTLLTNYADPESCLKYMAIGIVNKDAGLAAYIGALADSAGGDGVGFHAFFDTAVLNAYTRTTGLKIEDWNLGSERTQFLPYLGKLRLEPYVMGWTADEQHLDNVEDTRAVLHRHYRVVAVTSTDSLIIAVGYADLYFTKLSASRWALTRWEDRVDPDYGVYPANDLWRTFGYWRLNLSSREEG